MKGKFEYRGKNSEALDGLKKVIEEVSDVFIAALPDTKDRMSFKAMEFKELKSEAEQDMMLDVIMTALALQINEKAPKDVYAYSTSYEKKDESIIIWMHARRKVEGETEEEEAVPEAPSAVINASDVNYVI